MLAAVGTLANAFGFESTAARSRTRLPLREKHVATFYDKARIIVLQPSRHGARTLVRSAALPHSAANR